MPSRPLLSRRLLLSAAAVLFVGAGARAAAPIKAEGVTFAGSATVAGQALELNGVGLRAVAWIKGYAAGLYLARKASTPALVYAQNGAKRLRLVMLLDVDAEEFVKAFHKGVDRNTAPTDLPRLTERMARFDSVVRSLAKLKKKDVIDLDFVPDRGLQLTYNGALRGDAIPGEDLYAALLRCFIGEKPVDAELKAGLLGGPVG